MSVFLKTKTLKIVFFKWKPIEIFLICVFSVSLVADTIKEDSAEAVSELKSQGIHVVMITGDNEITAGAIAAQAGVDEVVPGTSVVPSSETGMSRHFWGRIKGAKYSFALQDGTWEFSGDAVAGKGLILRWRGKHVVFLELRRDSRVTTGNSGFLLCWPRKSNLPFNLSERAGGCSRVTSGQRVLI